MLALFGQHLARNVVLGTTLPLLGPDVSRVKQDGIPFKRVEQIVISAHQVLFLAAQAARSAKFAQRARTQAGLVRRSVCCVLSVSMGTDFQTTTDTLTSLMETSMWLQRPQMFA